MGKITQKKDDDFIIVEVRINKVDVWRLKKFLRHQPGASVRYHEKDF